MSESNPLVKADELRALLMDLELTPQTLFMHLLGESSTLTEPSQKVPTKAFDLKTEIQWEMS